LIFDNQSCLLQITFTNLFDPPGFISNEKGCLFDNRGFNVFLVNHLNFKGNRRE